MCFAILGLTLAISANAQLLHRYDFATGANDIVGTANGTLGSGTISGGALITSGANTGVSLPGSAVAGIAGPFTIETWYYAIAPQGSWHTLFSFSDGTTGNYVIGQPVRNAPTYYSGASVNGAGGSAVGEQLMTGYAQDVWWDNPNQNPRQMLLTYDGATLSLYEDGTLAPFANNLADVGLNLSSLSAQIGIASGAPFGDPSLNGSTYDFRIYGQSVTADQAASLFALGADASTAAIITAVPEPSAFVLAGFGMLALFLNRRRS